MQNPPLFLLQKYAKTWWNNSSKKKGENKQDTNVRHAITIPNAATGVRNKKEKDEKNWEKFIIKTNKGFIKKKERERRRERAMNRSV